MFTPNDMRQWLAICKNEIAEINFVQAIIDDSQMTNDISQRKYTDNLLLYGVLPDYGADTRTEDALMMRSGFDFLILKKAQRSNQTMDMLLDDMEETLQGTQKLLARVVEEMRNPQSCELFYYLEENSIQIVPVWGKAGTNGYMMSLNLRSPQ